MTKPILTIITVCYNAEKTIERTIQSVLSQTYKDLEYIIIDGSSTDGTLEVINQYQSDIDLVVSEPDQGIYDAFNKGVKRAKGTYIQYLNADDYLLNPYVIQQAVDAIKNKPDAVIYYGGILIQNEITGYFSAFNREIPFDEFAKGQMLPHPAMFTQKKAMQENGFFDTSYKIAADYELTSKIFNQSPQKVTHLPILISVFCTGGISSQLSNQHIMDRERNRIAKAHFNMESFCVSQTSNEDYLKIWLEKELYENKHISEVLIKMNVKAVVIWGSGMVSNLLLRDIRKNEIKVQAFIDNNIQKQGLAMNEIPIQTADWLIEHTQMIDAIIFGFEGRHEQAVQNQLEQMNIELPCYSWRQLLEMN